MGICIANIPCPCLSTMFVFINTMSVLIYMSPLFTKQESFKKHKYDVRIYKYDVRIYEYHVRI